MKKRTSRVVLASAVCAMACLAFAEAQSDAKLIIQADRPGARVSPTMWGIFFEDINLAGDGGVYAELVKNRSFEFAVPLMGWTEIRKDEGKGSFQILDRGPLNPSNPHFLRIKPAAGSGFTLSNEGFRGISVEPSATYAFSTYARSRAGASMSLKAELIGAGNRTLATETITGFGSTWKKHSVTLRVQSGDPKARLQLTVAGTGSLDLDMVSLFPDKTWQKRAGGLRSDLVQLLAELKPGFLRFPGGCIVEGQVLARRYQWKKTLGDPSERETLINRWNEEFKHRPTPDYFQSFGLGFFEYFQLCEDIGAEPLPILNCGMACQFNSGERVAVDELDPYIQDMLDLIEFANGPVTSVWGKKRADLGHPKPFGMKLLGIGNEQWGPQYLERYERIAKELEARYPDIKLVSAAGPNPNGAEFDLAWKRLRELNADIIDEHYYRPPSWFLENTHRYDGYDRKGPKVFAGEYAAQSVRTGSPENRNNLQCALAEAAFMTGLERNADVVVMASYAPLFAHVDGWQWTPNLIWFDNLRSYGTPDYYVQQLFSVNRGDVVLPVKVDGGPAASDKPTLFASATRDDKSGEIILKVVNVATTPASVDIQVPGIAKLAPTATLITLTGERLTDENSLTEPKKVAPVQSSLSGVSPAFTCVFKPISMTVVRLGTR